MITGIEIYGLGMFISALLGIIYIYVWPYEYKAAKSKYSDTNVCISIGLLFWPILLLYVIHLYIIKFLDKVANISSRRIK